MFFVPKFIDNVSAVPLRFTSETKLSLSDGAPYEIINKSISRMATNSDAIPITSLSVSLDIPLQIIDRIPDYAANEEEYIISLDTEAKIYAKSLRGVMYALVTLEQLNNSHELAPLFLYDYPLLKNILCHSFLTSYNCKLFKLIIKSIYIINSICLCSPNMHLMKIRYQNGQ